jgi:hypothetical protein
MKKNPVLVVLATAAVLGAVFFVLLFLAYSLTGSDHPPNCRSWGNRCLSSSKVY